jgi:hypothetical protein
MNVMYAVIPPMDHLLDAEGYVCDPKPVQAKCDA